MSARLQETGEWSSKFVRGLPGPYKALWFWLKSNCDHGGVWDVDIDLARLMTGFYDLEQQEAERLFSAKIMIVSGGDKWLLIDFCEEQFKTRELNPANTYHRGAIRILEKVGAFKDEVYFLKKEIKAEIKPLDSGFEATKEKEKDKYKEKESIKLELDEVVLTKPVPKKVDFEIFWNEYDKKIERDKCQSKWDKLSLNDQEAAIVHIPKYKSAEPNKKFRKNPDTYLNNKCWNDEIIEAAVIQMPAQGEPKPDRIAELARKAVEARNAKKQG